MTGQKQSAPTLYAIIAIKLGKGLLLLMAAAFIYSLLGDDLPREFRDLLKLAHLDPERAIFVQLTEKLASITPANIYSVAFGTAFYSLFSLVEGAGLIFRVSWAGWMAIGESLFFIPIEVYNLMHKVTRGMMLILALNLVIVFYLLRNRNRLFHHSLRAEHETGPAADI